MTWLVYLSANGVRVMRRSGKHLISMGEADSAGAAALFTHIPDAVAIRILVDSAEDVYQTIALPHVIGRARRHMLARHLQAFAVNNAYAAVSWQARLSAGRRDDMYLFAAIQASDWLQTYLHALQHAHVVCMTSTAMLVQQLAALGKPATALWVTQSTGGVRLTLVVHGQMLFTRLLNAGLVVADEISKTQQYLVSHQLLSASENLSVHHHDEDSLAALARHPQLLNFATPTMLQAHKQARGQQAWVMAALLIILSGLTTMIYLYQQNQQFAAQWQNLAQTPAPAAIAVPANIYDMQASVVLAQQLHNMPEPVADLAWLSEILTRYPRLQIVHLTWRAAAGGSLLIAGEVRPFAGDYIVAMAEVEAFMAALRSMARVSLVQALALPINRDPQVVVQGGAAQKAAKFELQVSLRGGA